MEGAAHENPDRKPCGAVILGGAHGSLAVARSLGRRGVPVWFVTDDHPIAKYSRFVSRSFGWPGPEDGSAAAWLIDMARRNDLDGWTLFAGGDAEVRFVAEHRAVLEQAFVPITPGWDMMRFACDKRLAYQHAERVGVGCPWSFYPRDRDEVAATAFRFPVVLKPAYRKGRNAFTAAKAWRADNRAALAARYDEAAALVGDDAVVIQEWIPGGGEAQFSYAAVWDNGVPVASLVARRMRQYPLDFGFTSTFVEVVENADVESAAVRFLAALRFRGLVEVEFKYDAREGRLKLLDVNPRPWTWIGLSEAAGVDLAWIQWRLSRGEPAPMARARPGAAWTHASRDYVAAAQQVFRGTLRPLEFAASLLKPRRFAAFAVDDPWPAIADLPVLMARMIGRRFARGAQRPSAFDRGREEPYAETPRSPGPELAVGQERSDGRRDGAKAGNPPILGRGARQARL